MTMPCYQTLDNNYLIHTLQNKSGTGEKEVYDCLKKIFHETMINRLIKTRRDLPGPDTQRMIAEEAFQEAFIILLKNVREGSFEAKPEERKTAGSIAYFFGILWNTFQNELKRRCNRNFYSFNEDEHSRPVHMSADLPVYNRKDGLLIILQTAVATLNGKCRTYMQWQYMEGRNTEEIISMVKDAPGTVKKDLSNCRKKLQDKIKELCNIDF